MPASTAASLLSLMPQVGGAAGEAALQRTVAALLSERAWKHPSPNPWSHHSIPETGLPDPAVTRVAVCCLAAACASVEDELGVAGMAGGPTLWAESGQWNTSAHARLAACAVWSASQQSCRDEQHSPLSVPAGSPALLKLVASLLVEATACLQPPTPQPAGGDGPGALPHWERAQIDRVAADRAKGLPSLEAAHQMLQHMLMGCLLHLLAGHGSGGVEISAGSAGGSQREEGFSQPAQAAAPSPSAQPAKKGAH